MSVPNPIQVAANAILTSATYNANNSNIATRLNNATLGAVFKNEDAVLAGAITFTQSPTINAPLAVGGALSTSGGVTVAAGGLIVVAGGATIGGSVSILGDLSITGVGFFTGAGINVNGTLGVAGSVGLTGFLNGTGAAFSAGISAASFGGIGTSLTALTASNLLAGGTLPALNGAALTSLNASALQTGSVPTGLLPTSYAALSVTSLVSGTLTTVGINASGTATLNAVTMTTLQVDNSMITTTPPTGAVRYFQFTDNFGNVYRLTGALI